MSVVEMLVVVFIMIFVASAMSNVIVLLVFQKMFAERTGKEIGKNFYRGIDEHYEEKEKQYRRAKV